MGKVAIIVNGTEPKNVYPPFILGSSAAACNDEVLLFFTPGGAPAMVKGAIEKLNAAAPKLPDLEELCKGLLALKGSFVSCALMFMILQKKT